MNRVDRSDAFAASGRSLVSDHALEVRSIQDRRDFVDNPPPVIEGDHGRELVVVRARLNAGVAVQLLLDRGTGEMFVTTVVAGQCVTVPVERGDANEWYDHPGAFGLLPQLAR